MSRRPADPDLLSIRYALETGGVAAHGTAMTASASVLRFPTAAAPRAIARWLLAVAILVFCMVVVGGVTRLTESGLSITQWKPITGAIPPLTHDQWMEAFRLYQQIPEYREINRGMTLGDFQFIFFWEWAHRLLGRLIGVAFALPLIWFAWKRAIPAGYGWRLTALLALGGLQGAIGWWMVESGLSVRTDVSHYRLAVHLLTALFIMGGLIWTALDLLMLARHPAARPARMRPFALAALLALFAQLLFGAFTAGLDAGYVSNTWPLMNDHLVPEGISWMGSLWATVSSDPYLVHFIHRWWAWVTAALLILLARRAKKAGQRGASIAINATVGTQVLLGIATVISGIALPLAVLHQAVGALVVASAAWGAHAIGRRRA
jgi:cytochrome c oxidase assembly protein subunit 15